MMSLLKIENLVKTYGTFKALNQLNLEVKEKEIYGFIGRNGAGKTTTLHSIMQFISFDEGIISFDGKPLNKDDNRYKEYISFVPDVPSFPEYLKGREVLMLTADFIGIQKEKQKALIDSIIEKTYLPYPNKKVSQYSRGMKQRLAIACG
ncbi:ABC transporter ATP-binding protein, partial [Methanocalculus natronophilus]|uniref:ABC transporter ATP-binding protein n=1 Tax=Methanocalculus natronophilus TaxID=1262400 RepID=UPI0031B5A7D4